MNKRYIILGIIIILAAFIGLSLYKQPAKPVSQNVVTNDVTYYCEEGAIVADYGTSSVALNLSDGRSMTIAQTISGSGIRYATGTLVFWSEGNNAFITEGSSTTFTNCVSGTEKSVGANTINYTDAPKTFSFDFPNQFGLSGEGGYSQDWALESTSSGILFAQVSIPRTFMPGTNFADAKFTVGASADPDALADCLTAQFPEMEKATRETINGVQFTKFTFSDAGAGNFYDTTSYRTIKNNECYAIEYTIHSGDFYNYPTGSVTMFDEAKVQSVLDGIAQSFTFI